MAAVGKSKGKRNELLIIAAYSVYEIKGSG